MKRTLNIELGYMTNLIHFLKSFVIIIVFHLLIFHQNGFATELDSLENLLEKHTELDTVRVNLLNETSAKLFGVDENKAFSYAKEAGEIASGLSFIRGVAESSKNLAYSHLRKADFNKAFVLYNEALKNYQKINDIKRITLCYNNIAVIYRKQSNYPKAIEYNTKALQMREADSDELGISSSLTNIGVIYYMQGNYSMALEYYERSLLISEKINFQRGSNSCYSNIGLIYQKQGNYPLAIENYHKALKISELIGDKNDLATKYLNIGAIYLLQKDYTKAIDYHQMALEMSKEVGDQYNVLLVFNNIGIIYQEKGDYQKALEFQHKALEICDELGVDQEKSRVMSQIGTVYLIQEDYDQAFNVYQQALAIAGNIDAKETVAGISIGLASVYLQNNKTNEAYNYSQKAYVIANEIGNTMLLQSSSEILAKTYARMGLFEKAYEYYVVFKSITDSLFNENNVKKITNLENQYAFDKEKESLAAEQVKKEAIQATQLKNQKQLRNIFIVGFLFFLGLALVIFRNLIQKKKDNRLLAQQKEEIQTQSDKLKTINSKLKELDRFKQTMTGMIVHDLKNPLNSILSRPADERIKHHARQMLTMVMNILDIQKFEDASMKIETSASLLMFSINNAIEHISIPAKDKNIEIRNTIVNDITILADPDLIERILTNLLTNAIKFTPNNGKVTLVANNEDEEYLKIQVEDNGTGIPNDKQFLIFEKFGQIEAKQLGHTRSTGLGLTFCKLAVEAHGGEIGVESDGENGAVFWFTLKKSIKQNNLSKQTKIVVPELGFFNLENISVQLQLLSQIKFYEVSKIREALFSISDDDNPNVKKWKVEVLKAVTSGNEELYLKLIKQRNNEGKNTDS